jgi:sugar phosphate isomerase/epimerase
MYNKQISRREFAGLSTALAAGLAVPNTFSASHANQMKLGLVTYLWGKDMDLPTLIKACEDSKVLGIELRVEHAHGVMPNLSADQRKEVKKRFDDSPVENIGCGTNQEFDDPDPAKVKANIEGAKEFIKLSHDTGGSGVKVKPNDLHDDVDKEKTIEQIGKSLNEVGKFAEDYGQEIRVEVHGSCSPLPIMKAIFDHVDQKNVGMCWNCNGQDLNGEGLEYNFNLVKDRFGSTVHVRELNVGDYPYQKLISLFKQMHYSGWILLECRTDPDDKVKAMIEQHKIFGEMLANA